MLKPAPVSPGDRIAVLSPAWSAPAYYPHIHTQAMERLSSLLSVEVVEFPTTLAIGASAQDRAADLNAAFADPSIRAIFTTVGGDDLITVTPHLDPELPKADPKHFFGYSDNTNISHWLFSHGISSFYGGATQVHFGPGPRVDDEHLATVRAALAGEELTLSMPASSEDYGLDWSDPAVLTASAPRESAEPIEFIGTDTVVRGRTWGGCMEVIDQLALADRLPKAEQLEGSVLIFETSEILPPADYVGRWIRALGERGYLDAATALMFARPVVDDRDAPAPANIRQARREAYAEYLLSNIVPYRSDLLVCLGVPFGHTRPQVILPYGGEVTLDPVAEKVIAHY